MLVVSDLAERVPGGVGMRQRALFQALSANVPTRRFTVGADRFRGCPAGCAPKRHAAAAEPADPFADTYCPAIYAALRQAVAAANPSVVVVTGLSLHRYALGLAETGACHVVFDAHNVEYPLALTLARAAAESTGAPSLNSDDPAVAAALAVRRVEQRVIEQCRAVWVCSAADREAVGREYGPDARAKTSVVPNALDVPRTVLANAGDRTPAHAVFTGRFDYLPNLDAAATVCERIAPALALSAPRLPVLLAGAAADAVRLVGVQVPENVRLVSDPADVSALIRDGVMIVPLAYGGGTRFKVLEAMALGAPVVSTAKGVEGLEVQHGRHYVRVEEPAAFADAIAMVAANGALRRAMARAAAEKVTHEYSLAALASVVRVNLTPGQTTAPSTSD
jgi:glycosyltransferase involved in cell wall biosynthesis